ncbi:hypothetical protein B0J18DRAFT_19454 [Chaetomium sp. MPI-SDFR-AT-0129]|nr:hypothetical protein B0J18DRAFT_19454 [Chaetomium sp. MPI-SDFR-AT-0129]
MVQHQDHREPAVPFDFCHISVRRKAAFRRARRQRRHKRWLPQRPRAPLFCCVEAEMRKQGKGYWPPPVSPSTAPAQSWRPGFIGFFQGSGSVTPASRDPAVEGALQVFLCHRRPQPERHLHSHVFPPSLDSFDDLPRSSRATSGSEGSLGPRAGFNPRQGVSWARRKLGHIENKPRKKTVNQAGMWFRTHHVGSRLAVMPLRKLGLIAVARLKVSGQSTLNCLRRHFVGFVRLDLGSVRWTNRAGVRHNKLD